MFCLYFNAKDKSIRALNGSGRSPAGRTAEELRKELGLGQDSGMPFRSAHSVTVPGAAAGWVDCVACDDRRSSG